MLKVADRPSVLAKRGVRAFGNLTIKAKANYGLRIVPHMGRYWSLTWSWRGYNVSHVAPGRVNEGNERTEKAERCLSPPLKTAIASSTFL